MVTDGPEALVGEAVADLDDLPGTYVQPFALPGGMRSLTFEPMVEGEGAYVLYRSCGVVNCAEEVGAYHALPENPAIGFAFFTLIRDGASGPEGATTYVIDRLWRAADGTLVALELRRVFATGPMSAPFLMWKLPPSPVPLPAPQAGAVPPMDGPVAVARAEATPRSASDAATVPIPNLAGVYVRTAPVPGDIGAITLTTPSWLDLRATGTYEAAFPYCLPWCFPEAGTYELEVKLWTTGSGWIRLGERRYLVLAIWRDVAQQVTALQLQRLGAAGVVDGPPFTMIRQWWTPSETEADEPSAACSYYRSLAQYFAIRALQCGNSACWPLSGVYGMWSQVYAAMAAEACAD